MENGETFLLLVAKLLCRLTEPESPREGNGTLTVNLCPYQFGKLSDPWVILGPRRTTHRWGGRGSGHHAPASPICSKQICSCTHLHLRTQEMSWCGFPEAQGGLLVWSLVLCGPAQMQPLALPS